MKESPKRSTWFAAIAEPTTVKLRTLCSTRWILRKDCIDAFLVTYSNLMNMLEDMNKDSTVSGAVRSSAFSHLLNLVKYGTHFILRMLQRFFGMIYPFTQNACHAEPHRTFDYVDSRTCKRSDI